MRSNRRLQRQHAAPPPPPPPPPGAGRCERVAAPVRVSTSTPPSRSALLSPGRHSSRDRRYEQQNRLVWSGFAPLATWHIWAAHHRISATRPDLMSPRRRSGVPRRVLDHVPMAETNAVVGANGHHASERPPRGDQVRWRLVRWQVWILSTEPTLGFVTVRADFELRFSRQLASRNGRLCASKVAHS
jgi:hypothetical protein